MPLSAGDKLGHYEVLSLLGQGGMGEVYKARDTTLKRDVALKVLPASFLRDSERMGRFQREAEVLASLDHPNVGPIYGIVESADSRGLVLALIEGPTLADRIEAGPIAIEEAVAIAKQIIEALEYAHERGVVHRDLKPANIKITTEGVVKVLDFGLAKVLAEEPPPSLPTSSPTLTMGHTSAGVILGTAAYMSPEQAVGRPVDRRSDIFSFGAVLYEMLAGKRAFGGATTPDVLEAVVKNDPDWSKLPAGTPAYLRRLLERTLVKDRKQRLQAIGEARIALENSRAEEPPALSVSAPSPSRLPWVWPAVAGLAAVCTLGVLFIHFREKPAAAPAVTRFQIRLPEKVGFTTSGSFTLSPDGRHAAFSAIGTDNTPRVWIQDLDALEARVLPDTYTGPNPPPFFWSPDSRFVVYSENSPKLKKADVQTGALQDICDKPGPPIGGAWSKDNIIIFGSTSTGLWKVPAAGGTPVPLTKLDASRHEREHELPSFLLDGRHFLYLRLSTMPEETGIFAGSLDDPPERQSGKRILATGFGAYFASSSEGPGRLLFLRDDTLMAQPFDPEKLELSGDPVPVVRGVGSAYQTGLFSASGNALAYRTSASIRDYQLTWFDRRGNPGGTAGEPGNIAQIRLSPDGTRVSYRKTSSNLIESDLWLLDLSRDNGTRFTFGPSNAEYALWSPDGTELVFSSDREGVFNLYRKPANGSREEELLLKSNLNKRALSWSRDGKFLLYATSPAAVFSEEDIWVLPMQGDRTPYPLVQTRFDESDATFSPDGRWVAYHSNETGRYEVYVREFGSSKESAATGGKWIVSKDGGSNPAWREDGKELLYTDHDRKLMSVSVDSTRIFQAGTPRELFQLPAASNLRSAAGDLKRFLIPVAVERKAAQGFTVVLNWASPLKP
jgi:serine/threonine protein kinase